MHDYPNPSLDGPLILLCLFVAAVLAGAMVIEKRLARKYERERQAIEDARNEAGAEAYVHHDRCC